MRITFIVDTANLSGGIRAISIYARKLAARGHSVCVVSRPFRAVPLQRRVKSLLKGKGWQPAVSKRASHLDGIEAAGVEHRVIDDRRPVTDADVPDADVVIATWWETAEWVAQLSPAKGAKVYFVQHHEVVFANQPVERVAATYRIPDMRKICCARWIVDVMRDEYGDPAAVHVPYGIDHEQFHAPPRGRQATPTVGMMYSRSRWKGCDISFKAYELAAQRVPNLRLVTFGSNTVGPEMPLPPGDVTFMHSPPQESIRDIYAGCDAWLFGSRSEGFGLPVLEAMACRTPVIATPTGAGPEAVKSGDNGFLVNHEDPAGMAEAIVRICEMDDAAWRQVSESAYRTAAGYDWEPSTEMFERALRSAASPRRGGEVSELASA